MCNPIAVGAMTGGLSLLATYQQDQAFEAEAEAQEMRHKVESERAQRDAEMSRTMLNQQALEQSTEIQRDRQRLALEALRERGSQRASGAESGLGGVSSIRSMLSTDLNEAQQASNINANVSNNLFRNQMEQAGININYQDRLQNSQIQVDNARRQKVGALDYLGAAGTGVTAGLQSYMASGGSGGGSTASGNPGKVKMTTDNASLYGGSASKYYTS